MSMGSPGECRRHRRISLNLLINRNTAKCRVITDREIGGDNNGRRKRRGGRNGTQTSPSLPPMSLDTKEGTFAHLCTMMSMTHSTDANKKWTCDIPKSKKGKIAKHG